MNRSNKVCPFLLYYRHSLSLHTYVHYGALEFTLHPLGTSAACRRHRARHAPRRQARQYASGTAKHRCTAFLRLHNQRRRRTAFTPTHQRCAARRGACERAIMGTGAHSVCCGLRRTSSCATRANTSRGRSHRDHHTRGIGGIAHLSTIVSRADDA